jgi:hypothetical protein
MVEVRGQEDELEEIVAAIAADRDLDDKPVEPNALGVLKYRAANDNSERTWLRWLWLALAFLVPLSLAALLRLAFGWI